MNVRAANSLLHGLAHVGSLRNQVDELTVLEIDSLVVLFLSQMSQGMRILTTKRTAHM